MLNLWGAIKFSTKIFAASKILHYLCIAMLEVTIQQCEDMKYIRIAKRIRSYIANAPQMIVTSVCGAFLYPPYFLTLSGSSFECFKQQPVSTQTP